MGRARRDLEVRILTLVELRDALDLATLVTTPAVELLVVGGAARLGALELPTGAHAIAPVGVAAGDALLAVLPLAAAATPRVLLLADLAWRPGRPGVHHATLLRGEGVWTRLVRLGARTVIERVHTPDGEDLLVLDGDLDDGGHPLGRLDAVASVPGTARDLRSEGGCMLLVRSPLPSRAVALATILLHEIAATSEAEAVATYAAGAYLAAPLDDLDPEEVCERFFVAEQAPREDHVREVAGQAGLTAFHRAAVVAAVDAFRAIAPGRASGPAFDACRDARDAAARDLRADPDVPIARAFAADLVARWREVIQSA